MFSLYPRFVELDQTRVLASWCQDIYAIEKKIPIIDRKITILPNGPNPLWLIPITIEWISIKLTEYKVLEIKLETFEPQSLEVVCLAGNRTLKQVLCLNLKLNKTVYEIPLNLIPKEITNDLLQISFAHSKKLQVSSITVS